MKYLYSSFFSLFTILIGTNAFAGFNAALLDIAKANGDREYAGGSRAMPQAISFSLMQTPERVKIPGAGRFYFESGIQISEVDHQILAAFIDSQYCPASFETIYLKGGIGLPYGFSTELGVSQVISDTRLTGVNASISYQVFDFSTWVYTDMVPSMSLNASVMRTIVGPSQYSFTGQANLGAYHRTWLAQFAYVIRYNQSYMTATQTAFWKQFIQHGIISHVPIFPKWVLRNEIYYPKLAASISLGYQF